MVMRFGHDYDQTCMQMDEVGVSMVNFKKVSLCNKFYVTAVWL